jgi:hypothetical protein
LWAKCGLLTQGYSGNSCQKFNTYEEAVLAWYCQFIGQDDNYIERGLLPTMPTNIWKNRCLDSSSENYANASTSSNQDDSSYSQCSSATIHGSHAQPTSDEEWEPQCKISFSFISSYINKSYKSSLHYWSSF